ncbi:MAG: LysR substrate-binding domain-containing protein [Hyphomicrobiaceae bacterium]
MGRAPRRLPLTALRTFEAAARLESFKDAAEELGVSATTVSNQIRSLERDWNCQLFIRKTRQVLLTDSGRSLAHVVKRAFDSIEREVAQHTTIAKRRVALSVGPIFAARWLMPRLKLLRRAHPDIELTLHHGPRITSVGMMSTPIAVDWGHGEWAGLDAEKLLDIVYSPVASPGLIHEAGAVTRPKDLARLPVIHQHDRSEWSAWLALAGVAKLRFASETVILDSNVVTQAAMDGQGVALGIFPFIQDEVDAGRLLKLFDIDLSPTRSYFVLTRPGSGQSREVETVRKWLIDEARRSTSGNRQRNLYP